MYERAGTGHSKGHENGVKLRWSNGAIQGRIFRVSGFGAIATQRAALRLHSPLAHTRR